MRRRTTIRHDEGCSGGEECDCDDDQDCDEDEECDEEEGECVEREDGADSLRRYLARRYDADVSGVPAIVVARRAATILGVRTDGLSDVEVIVRTTLRADAEWSEDDHPRGDDGKFAAAGGATAGRDGVAKSHDQAVVTLARREITSGAGHSANTHADKAQRSADGARAAASGTNASARASARKAAESAALARVAASNGDRAGAAQHAEAASRHYQAAVQKAAEHSGSTTNAVANRAAAPQGASKAAWAKTEATKSKSGASLVAAHAAAAAAHEVARAAHQSAGSGRTLGREHADAATYHRSEQRRLAPTTKRIDGDPLDEARDALQTAGAHQAYIGRETARPNPARHGLPAMIGTHERAVSDAADEASRAANVASKMATSPRGHDRAAQAHETAAAAQRIAGNDGKASLHDSRAAQHRASAAGTC